MNANEIIERYRLDCERERKERTQREADIEARCADINAYLLRVSRKDRDISGDGVMGGMEVVKSMFNPYHFLRLAAENLKAARASDAFLVSQGKSAATKHTFLYTNRVASFRQRAVELFRGVM